MRSRLSAAIASAALVAVLVTGCATPEVAQPPSVAPTPSQPAPTVEPVQTTVGEVATVLGPEIIARDAADGAPVTTLTNPNASGAPLVFLITEKAGDWLRVLLPVRPNGSEGWVRADEVSIATLEYRLEVSTADRTVTLLQGDEVVRTFSAAIGTGDTPTPLGTFYLTELLAPTNHGYGPYAYGISAFSDVLNSFGGGPGQIGMHGTDDSDSIGQAASHGCIRLSNEDITYLAGILPLGTPITIA
jgi:lipoprotein-anchoring transpeptidase ErfK/SrfK